MSAVEATHDPLPISIADVEAAAERISGVAVRTPVLTSPTLDVIAKVPVFVKAECLQRTGSFKFRGAYNRLALIPHDVRSSGVVACSSGNHAQGVAEAARLFGVPATIVMPHDAPALKRARTERSGAVIVGYDRVKEDREAIAKAIAERSGATFIHPYDDPGVMAGQGTAGLELADALADVADPRVLVPASGGGLMAGIAVALADRLPGAVTTPAEPAHFDDHTRSLREGQRVSNTELSGSIADALLAERPGTLTFAVHRRHSVPGFAVTDAALMRAMAFALNELKIVLEPGGAAGLAAVLEGLVPTDRPIAIVASGGNADPALLARALSA